MNDYAAGDNPELIVHVGVPKTGTTAIQTYLYSNRIELAKQAVIYPDTYLEGFSTNDQCAHHLHAHKWNGWLDRSRFRITPDDAWTRLAQSVAEKPGRYIISSERFADLLPTKNGKHVLEFICKTVHPIPVRVLGYVRRQDRLAESFLKQAVKVGVFKGTRASYIQNPPAFLDYARLFSNAAEVVGWDNVIARVYERDQLKNGDAVADLLNTLGIAPPQAPSKDTASINASINNLSTAVILKLTEAGVNESPNVMRFLNGYLNRNEFDQFDRYSIFTPDEQEIIWRSYRKSNKELSKHIISGRKAIEELLPSEPEIRPSILDLDGTLSVSQLCEIVTIVRNAVRAGVLSEVSSRHA